MSLMIGVISYLPEDETIRQKRLDARKKQSEWLKSIFPNKKINVVAQCYKEEELIPYENNMIFNKGIGAASARNILLDLFHDSNNTHLMIIDDDLLIYDYYNYIEFLKDLDDNPNKYDCLDVILSSTPQFNAFKKPMYEDYMNRTHFKFTRRSPYWSGGIIIMKKLDVAYDDVPVEDADFTIRLVLQNYKVYVADFMQMKLINTPSVTFGKDRVANEKELRLELARRYNIPINNGVAQFTKSLAKSYDSPVYIPRLTYYNFPDTLVPNDYKNKNKLF